MYDGGDDEGPVHGRVKARGGGAVLDERSDADRGDGGAGDHADDAASLAAPVAGERRLAGKAGGEAASIAEGVASGSGIEYRAVAP